MAAPEPSSGIFALSFGAMLASAPFGVSFETIALGMVFAIIGCLGRVGFNIQKALEAGDKVGLSQSIGWAAAGMLGSPFVTILWVLALKMANIQNDLLTASGLVFLGFSGSKGILWLMTLLTDFLKSKLGNGTPPPKIGGQ